MQPGESGTLFDALGSIDASYDGRAVPASGAPPASPRHGRAEVGIQPPAGLEAQVRNAGHRQRLKQRFMQAGPDALADYELLELLLFGAIRRGDTKPLAKRLMTRFGSFAEVVNASEQRLAEVDGVGEACITLLKSVRAAALRLVKAEAVRRPVIGSGSALLDYIRLAHAYSEREQFRVLFLDKRNHIIADEQLQEGTIDHTPVYIREVVKRALEVSASAIILVHNHPSGDPTPSRADIDMTRQIVDAARPLGIAVHDHVVVGRHGHVSFRATKLI